MSHGPLPGLALLAWIPLSIFIFARYSAPRATVICIFGAHLFLPELAAFDFPLVPPMDKDRLSSLTALVLLWMFHPRRVADCGPYTLIGLLFTAQLVQEFGSVFTNQDGLSYGIWRVTHLPGLTPRDALSGGIRTFLDLAVPFWVGRMCFGSSRDLREGLRQFVWLGIIYLPLVAWELRMSPNLHTYVYGYPPHSDFLQTVRWGGWRPQVFTRHGLTLAMDMLGVFLLAVALGRARVQVWSHSAKLLNVVLGAMLLLCKSTGAILYGLFSFPLLRSFSPRWILRVAVSLALVALTYPYTRATGLFPTEYLLEQAEKISKDRADSLAFRFHHEEVLLEKALERPVFGWGGYGRNRVYHPGNGEDLSVTDGAWVLFMGTGGLVGLFLTFFYLAYPVLHAWLVSSKVRRLGDRVLMSAVALYLSLTLVDLLPNAGLGPVQLLLAGMLAAVARFLPHEEDAPGPAPWASAYVPVSGVPGAAPGWVGGPVPVQQGWAPGPGAVPPAGPHPPGWADPRAGIAPDPAGPEETTSPGAPPGRPGQRGKG